MLRGKERYIRRDKKNFWNEEAKGVKAFRRDELDNFLFPEAYSGHTRRLSREASSNNEPLNDEMVPR